MGSRTSEGNCGCSVKLKVRIQKRICRGIVGKRRKRSLETKSNRTGG